VSATTVRSHKARIAAERVSSSRYVAVAEANLGWVDIRAGRTDAGLQRCLDSLEEWGENGIYPIQALGAWPALAVAHSRGDRALCDMLVARMSEPRQQARPPGVDRDLASGRMAEALEWATIRNFA
jgi:hypothetical protein